MKLESSQIFIEVCALSFTNLHLNSISKLNLTTAPPSPLVLLRRFRQSADDHHLSPVIWQARQLGWALLQCLCFHVCNLLPLRNLRRSIATGWATIKSSISKNQASSHADIFSIISSTSARDGILDIASSSHFVTLCLMNHLDGRQDSATPHVTNACPPLAISTVT